ANASPFPGDKDSSNQSCDRKSGMEIWLFVSWRQGKLRSQIRDGNMVICFVEVRKVAIANQGWKYGYL
ncbi:MAG TPA: hypothetical protein DEA78_18120, partial [Cyanobacteria bacterium UBA11159]|nr:hypothetical protein [Cyanobacteria bacterium UBA11159]HBS72412.1 hypothetical protein [Cyanobacteria bacterium UBA11153]